MVNLGARELVFIYASQEKTYKGLHFRRESNRFFVTACPALSAGKLTKGLIDSGAPTVRSDTKKSLGRGRQGGCKISEICLPQVASQISGAGCSKTPDF